MGLPVGALGLLLAQARSDPFTGSVLTLGKQDTWITEAVLRERAASAAVKLADVPLEISPKPEFAQHGYLTDESVLRAMGFTEYHSLDLSAYEESDVIHDLNSDELPQALAGNFDVVLDSGTLEHVFHLPNALRAIDHLLRCGGRAIHLEGASNLVDHGFYMFSPTFFWDYYRANGYEIREVRIVRLTQRHATRPWEVFEYHPGSMLGTAFGGLDGGIFHVWCVARKTSESTGNAVPQQGTYVEAWEAAQASDHEPVAAGSPQMRPWRRALHRVTTQPQRIAVGEAYLKLLHLSYLNRFAFLRGPVRIGISLRRRNFGLRRIAKY